MDDRRDGSYNSDMRYPLRLSVVILIGSVLVACHEDPVQNDDVSLGKDASVEVALHDAAIPRPDAATANVADGDAAVPTTSAHSCNEHYEPNDTPALACPIEPKQRVDSELVAPADKKDHFTFPVVKDHVYTLTLTALACTALDIQLASLTTGQAVQLVAKTQYGGRGVYEFTANAVGAAQLVVELRSGDSCAYQFTVLPSTSDGLEHDPVTLEPNDSGSTAAPLLAPVHVASDVSVPNDRVDYFTFAVEQSKVYSLRLATTACSALDFEVASLGSGNAVQQIGGTHFGGVTVQEFTALYTGPAQLSVALRSGDSCGYEAAVFPSTKDGLQHDPRTYEPNDSMSIAAPLALGVTVTADLATPADRVDQYTFPVEAGRVLSWSINHTDCPALDITFSSLGSGQAVQQLSTTQWGPAQSYEATPSSSGLGLLAIRLRTDGSCAYTLIAR